MVTSTAPTMETLTTLYEANRRQLVRAAMRLSLIHICGPSTRNAAIRPLRTAATSASTTRSTSCG